MFDAHHHIWKYTKEEFGWIQECETQIIRDFSLSDAEAVMKNEGVTGSIVVQARQSLEETNWLLSEASKSEFVKGVVGWIDLKDTELNKALETYKSDKKLMGFRHVMQGEAKEDFCLNTSFQTGLKSLSQHGYCYDVLIYEDQLEEALYMMQSVPETQYILDHACKPIITTKPSDNWKTYMRLIAEQTNAFCKVSGLVTEVKTGDWSPELFRPYLDHLHACFGEDRLIYGSDWPVCLTQASYGEVLGLVEEYVGGRNSKFGIKFFKNNAMRAYGLTE